MTPLVAIHVLPSGPIPWRDHLLAVSALRFEGRRVTGRFSSLLHPARRPTRAALEALGRSMADFDEAPPFAEIESQLRAFLESDRLVGFGIKVTLEFLAAELARINACGFENPYLELGDLALERGVRVGKPGLGQLAAALDLGQVPPGNVDAVARLTAQVTARLLARPVEHGAAASVSVLADRWALLDPTRIRGVAETPGVYLFRDREGQVLYAGASGNLRRRLASYQSRPLELERRMEGLADRVWDIETRATDGYLEALIDEAGLIDAHSPPFNVQRQTRLPRRFLRASTAPPAGLRVVDKVQPDGAVYLGPFASGSVALRALALARSAFPELGRQALNAGARPSRRPSSAERARRESARAQAVRDALALLSGQREPAVRRVQAAAAQAARSGDRPEAARLLQLSKSIVSFQIAPSPLRDGLASRFAVAVLDSDRAPRVLYHLAAGRILERCDIDQPEAMDAHLARWRAEKPRVEPRHQAVPLVMRWLASQGARCVVTPLPPCVLEVSEPAG